VRELEIIFFGDSTLPDSSQTDTAMWIGFYSDAHTIIFSFWEDDLLYNTGTSFVGQWHHLCFTYDSVSLWKSIFVDGENVTSAPGVGQLSGPTAGIAPFTLGGTGGPSGARFIGALSDFRLWFGVLSSSEITTFYSKGYIPTFGVQPQAFYPLNDASDTVVDTVGGVTGTLQSSNVQWTEDIIPRPCDEKPAYRVQIPLKNSQVSTSTKKFYLPQPDVTYNCQTQAIDYIYALCCPA